MNEDIFLTDYFDECANFISNQDVMQSCKDAKKMIASAEEDPEQDLSALLTEYYVKLDKA